MSVIGNQFEAIIGESVDIRNIAFKNGVAGIKNNSIFELIEICQPLINTMVSIVSKQIKGNFAEIMYDKEKINEIYSYVGTNINMLKETQPKQNVFADFSEYISPKG